MLHLYVSIIVRLYVLQTVLTEDGEEHGRERRERIVPAAEAGNQTVRLLRTEDNRREPRKRRTARL